MYVIRYQTISKYVCNVLQYLLILVYWSQNSSLKLKNFRHWKLLTYEYVQTSTVAPKIDRKNLQNRKIKVGLPLKMEADVKGEPEPTITWTFKSKTLKSEGRLIIENKVPTTKVSPLDLVWVKYKEFLSKRPYNVLQYLFFNF